MDRNEKDTERIIQETKELEIPVFDAENAWKKISSETNATPGKKFKLSKILKYAAIIILGLGIGVFLQKLSSDKTDNKFVEITAREGQKIDISLPDGNKIWINSNSSIKYPIDFKDFNKRIFVQGEVYFEFSEENEKPLFVIVNEVVIQSFSGAFNVKTNAANTGADISVTQGWVTINNLEVQVNDLMIEEGYVCSFSSELPLFIAKNDNANYLAWKTGNLHFENTPLKIVAQTLSNHFGKDIQVEDKIQYCNFTSDYIKANLETILNDIEASINTKIDVEKNKVIIEGDDCQNI